MNQWKGIAPSSVQTACFDSVRNVGGEQQKTEGVRHSVLLLFWKKPSMDWRTVRKQDTTGEPIIKTLEASRDAFVKQEYLEENSVGSLVAKTAPQKPCSHTLCFRRTSRSRKKTIHKIQTWIFWRSYHFNSNWVSGDLGLQGSHFQPMPSTKDTPIRSLLKNHSTQDESIVLNTTFTHPSNRIAAYPQKPPSQPSRLFGRNLVFFKFPALTSSSASSSSWSTSSSSPPVPHLFLNLPRPGITSHPSGPLRLTKVQVWNSAARQKPQDKQVYWREGYLGEIKHASETWNKNVHMFF